LKSWCHSEERGICFSQLLDLTEQQIPRDARDDTVLRMIVRTSTNCSYGRNAVNRVRCMVLGQLDPVMRQERSSDDESDSYPWIGYHRSSIRRGACLALKSWINPCGVPV
jgi:hypothetical protein